MLSTYILIRLCSFNSNTSRFLLYCVKKGQDLYLDMAFSSESTGHQWCTPVNNKVLSQEWCKSVNTTCRYSIVFTM